MSLPSELLPVGLLGTGATGEYEIERSLRFNSADSAYLSRTPASAGNRKTWTYSFWLKRVTLGGPQSFLFAGPNGSGDSYVILDSDAFAIGTYGSGGWTWLLQSSAVFRDTSAWYHFVASIDTTQATASDRAKIYVNGQQITAFSTSTYPSQNFEGQINNNTYQNKIGADAVVRYSSGYLADVHFIDGQALDPISFGEFDENGIWQPIAYDGEYGTNGFHLDFADNSSNTATTLGKDTSGNGNNWTPNNLSVTAGAGNDSLVDVPTNGIQPDTGVGGEVRGNYCTLNPLAKGSSLTLSNGNLDLTDVATASPVVGSTFAVNSGKWYYEVILGNNLAYVGLSEPGVLSTSVSFLGAISGQIVYNTNNIAYSWIDGSLYNYSTASTCTTGDVIGVALNFDTGVLTFYKNGVSQGAFGSNVLTGRTFTPAFKSNNNTSASFNFGQRPFAYTAPSGFKALCTANLPAPVVTKPSSVFDVKLYTGNGSTQTISGLEFSPDLVWIKSRSDSFFHRLYDVIRGTTKALYSNSTDTEGLYQGDYENFTGFNSDGFSLGSATIDNGINKNGSTFVAWTWDAGSSTVENTDGSITSSVRANPSAGFSIVTWTGDGTQGATVGHGLGIKPSLTILKYRSSAANWWVKHVSIAEASDHLQLNTTSAVQASASNDPFNGSLGTSTTIKVGSSNVARYGNASGTTIVAYCFAPVEGYSAFGSYTGNGSTDGPFVYTNGFRPRWLLIKNISIGSNWFIFDSARNAFNAVTFNLKPNLSNAEETDAAGTLDLTANGFKMRSSGTFPNGNGNTIIYAAFAENPFALNVRAR